MFIASDPQRYLGTPVGNGHCVALVREATGAPLTAQWRRGKQARGGNLASGTAIATFDHHGRYINATDGRSHAAILLAEEALGLRVIDQWVGRAPAERLIRFKRGSHPHADDGDHYYQIITA